MRRVQVLARVKPDELTTAVNRFLENLGPARAGRAELLFSTAAVPGCTVYSCMVIYDELRGGAGHEVQEQAAGH